MKAFWDLSTCRQVGMGLGPIPWDSMVRYAQFYGLEDDVAEAFVYIIRAMDIVYLDWEREEAEQRRRQQK